MIVISGTISVDPEDHEAAVELFGPLVETTLTESGNGTYEYWAHLSDRGTFRVYEEWADQESVDAHMAAPHFVAFMEGFGALRVTGAEIYKHEVSGTDRFM